MPPKSFFNTVHSRNKTTPAAPSAKDKRPTSARDQTQARALAGALVKARLVTRAPAVKVWARAFRDLRELDKVPVPEVSAVLDWLCAHATNQYTPKVYSADGFRAKYPQVRDAMLRDRARNPVVKVTNPAKAVVRALAPLKWPGGFLANLPPHVQTSLDAYRNFVKRLTAIKESGVVSTVLGRLPEPRTFVRQWFEDKFSLVLKYPNTRPESVAFTPGHPDFVRRCRSWVNDYCGRPAEWDSILAEVSK